MILIIGHLFNLINDAAYDTVDAVEEAIRGSFDPEDPNSPNKDDIAKSLNSLETLLCCSTDNQFDLVEIWLHRNIFVFPSHLTEALLDHFKLDHTKLWDHLFPQERIATEECPYLEPDWERTKAEESETWNQLEQAKQEHLQVCLQTPFFHKKNLLHIVYLYETCVHYQRLTPFFFFVGKKGHGRS